MNKKRYIKITDFFKKNKIANTTLVFVYKILPAAVFITYPILLVFSLFKSTKDFFITLFVPASVFALVTVLRVIINEKRPYEKYNISSVFYKDTKGKSMPSRHTASAFIISFAAIRLSLPVGIFLLTTGCLIAISRVFAGVHYIRDVVAAAALSFIASILTFVLM